MKKIIYYILLFSLGVMQAQQIEKFSIDSGGNSITNGGIEILYTIGEVNVMEYSNNMVISEGFINPIDSGTLSIDSLLNKDVLVYPNPASEAINIKSDISVETVKIYNVFGSEVLSSKKLNIDIRQLQSGFYLMRITSKKGQMIKNIIIE